jgi:hypothetical protein
LACSPGTERIPRWWVLMEEDFMSWENRHRAPTRGLSWFENTKLSACALANYWRLLNRDDILCHVMILCLCFKKIPLDWRHGSSGRAAALQVQSPEFKPNPTKIPPLTGNEVSKEARSQMQLFGESWWDTPGTVVVQGRRCIRNQDYLEICSWIGRGNEGIWLSRTVWYVSKSFTHLH